MHDIKFINKQELKKSVHLFSFTKPTSYTFIPGQYAEFTLPHTSQDNRGNKRMFTLTSLPSDDSLSIILDIPQNCSSFKKHLLNINENDSIKIAEPMGDLIAPIDTSRPLVFIAGGLGIASFSSHLKQVVSKELQNPIKLHYAIKSPSDILLNDLIQDSKLEHHIYHDGNRINSHKILSDQTKDSLFFISGSERFTMSLVNELKEAGIDISSIVFDYFTGYVDDL